MYCRPALLCQFECPRWSLTSLPGELLQLLGFLGQKLEEVALGHLVQDNGVGLLPFDFEVEMLYSTLPPFEVEVALLRWVQRVVGGSSLCRAGRFCIGCSSVHRTLHCRLMCRDIVGVCRDESLQIERF